MLSVISLDCVRHTGAWQAARSEVADTVLVTEAATGYPANLQTGKSVLVTLKSAALEHFVQLAESWT